MSALHSVAETLHTEDDEESTPKESTSKDHESVLDLQSLDLQSLAQTLQTEVDTDHSDKESTPRKYTSVLNL